MGLPAAMRTRSEARVERPILYMRAILIFDCYRGQSRCRGNSLMVMQRYDVDVANENLNWLSIRGAVGPWTAAMDISLVL